MESATVVAGNPGRHVAYTGYSSRATAEQEANARLIAAAPELLGACKSALRALEDNLAPGPMDGDAKTALRLVIAQAEGVSHEDWLARHNVD